MRVHRNLRTQRWVLSTRGRKVQDCATVVLRDVRFVVSAARRQAVVAMRRREVHAWAVGEIVHIDGRVRVPPTARRGTYNPYRAATFTDAMTGQALLGARRVWFTNDGMFYDNNTRRSQ